MQRFLLALLLGLTLMVPRGGAAETTVGEWRQKMGDAFRTPSPATKIDASVLIEAEAARPGVASSFLQFVREAVVEDLSSLFTRPLRERAQGADFVLRVSAQDNGRLLEMVATLVDPVSGKVLYSSKKYQAEGWNVPFHRYREVMTPLKRDLAKAFDLPDIQAKLGGKSVVTRPRPVAPERPAAHGGSGAYASSWALVIGINVYEKVTPRLNYAVADARAVAEALPGLGFPKRNTRVLLDGEATKMRIENVLYRDFARMGPEDRLLVYFAGHGDTVPVRGGEEGYFLPVDADREALPVTAIPMEDVRRIGRRVKAKHVLFVMDACFSGFSMTRDVVPTTTTDAYLASALREPVVQVITAGRKGERAIEEGGHGLFTRRVLDGLRGLADPAGRGIISVAQLAAWLEPRVTRDSEGRMHPQYGKLDGEGQFVFIRPGAQLAAVQPERPASAPEPTITKEIVKEYGTLAIRGKLAGIEVWLDDRKIGVTEAGTALVMKNLPSGTYRLTAKKAGHKDWEREVQVAANQRAEVMIDIEALRPGLPPAAKSEEGAEMVLVPAGEFLMGSNDDDSEKPPHRVHLDGYYIDKIPVTNALYERFMRTTNREEPLYWTDSKWNGPTQPVVGVSWHDAEAYCKWAGKRLPTEAEWEKAARGTDGRKYPWGDQWDPSRAKSGESGYGKATPVGSYPGAASPYGALDMAGNVYQWVADWYAADYYQRSPARNPTGPESGSRKVIRGGSWSPVALLWRASNRDNHSPSNRAVLIGFRCARGLP